MEVKRIIFRGSIISYKIYGSGKPVVLLHGFGEDGSIWNAQADFLKQNFQIIVPDVPGSGASEMLQRENIAIADYADAVHAILEQENISSVTIIGHSMGGYITLAFAEKYEHMLNAFGLFHSGAYADDEVKTATRKKGIKFIAENGSRAFLKATLPALFNDAEKSKDDIIELIEKAGQFSEAALTQYYNAMISRPDTTKVLRAFPKPILMIIGEHDKAIPFSHSLQQSCLPREIYIHILRQSAHMGMLEETKKTNKILAQFLHSV